MRTLRLLRRGDTLLRELEDAQGKIATLEGEVERLRPAARDSEMWIARIADMEDSARVRDNEIKKLREESRRQAEEEEEFNREIKKVLHRIREMEGMKKRYERRIFNLQQELERVKRELRDERVSHSETKRLLQSRFAEGMVPKREEIRGRRERGKKEERENRGERDRREDRRGERNRREDRRGEEPLEHNWFRNLPDDI